MDICKTKDGRDSILITTTLITNVICNMMTLKEEIRKVSEMGCDPSPLEQVYNHFLEMYEVFLQHDGETPDKIRQFL